MIEIDFSDYSLHLMDSKTRPLDFVVIFKLKPNISYEHLNIGLGLALKNFPKMNSIIKGKEFITLNKVYELEKVRIDEVDPFVEEKIKTQLDLSKERGIKQYFIHSGDEKYLMTRFHHAPVSYTHLTLPTTPYV